MTKADKKNVIFISSDDGEISVQVDNETHNAPPEFYQQAMKSTYNLHKQIDQYKRQIETLENTIKNLEPCREKLDKLYSLIYDTSDKVEAIYHDL